MATVSGDLVPITTVNMPGRFAGKKMHVNSIHRQIHHGTNSPSGERVRLRAWKIAGVWYTTEAEVQKFLNALRSGDSDDAERIEDAEAVGRRLELAGC